MKNIENRNPSILWMIWAVIAITFSVLGFIIAEGFYLIYLRIFNRRKYYLEMYLLDKYL